MGSSRMGIVYLVVIFGCYCGQQGMSPEMDVVKTLRLDGVSVHGKSIASPYVLSLPRNGRVILEVGNPSGQPIILQLKNGLPSAVELPAKRWSQLHLRVNGPLEMTWQGDNLNLGSSYLKPRDKKKRTNVLLVSVDTLRWDRFTSQYMPGLATLFEEGLVFDRAYSPTPWTLPAHCSLLSGQYPSSHGVRLSDAKLPQTVETLAEHLSMAGYYNWALTEGNFVSARYGLNQGFHRYVEMAPAMMAAQASKVSKLEGNLTQARQQIKLLNDLPQFLFLHTYEVHCPFLVRGEQTDAEGMGQTQWLLDNDGKKLAAETYQHLQALYDGEVRFTDDLLAPFLRELWETGEWLIVFTSDHGEEFGEHGGLLHGDTLYDEALHVPLAFLGRDIRAEKRSKSVSLIDVAPTILSCLGLSLPDTWQGQSLLGSIEERPVFAESFFWGVHVKVENPSLLAVVHGKRKLIQAKNFGQVSAELYFLDQDPLEQIDLHANQVVIRDQLYLFLEAYQANQALAKEQTEALTPEQLEALRALGYVE